MALDVRLEILDLQNKFNKLLKHLAALHYSWRHRYLGKYLMDSRQIYGQSVLFSTL
jgi:hypothetical protein